MNRFWYFSNQTYCYCQNPRKKIWHFGWNRRSCLRFFFVGHQIGFSKWFPFIFMDSLCEANREKISCWPQKICRCGPSLRPACNPCNRNQAPGSSVKGAFFYWDFEVEGDDGLGDVAGTERDSRMNWSSHMFVAEEYSLTSVGFKLHYLIPCWIMRCFERQIDMWVFFEFCTFRCRTARVKRYSRLKCRYHIYLLTTPLYSASSASVAVWRLSSVELIA